MSNENRPQPPAAPKLTKTEVNVACRGSQNCTGKAAIMTRTQGTNYVRYKCKKCNQSWGLNLGGGVSL